MNITVKYIKLFHTF